MLNDSRLHLVKCYAHYHLLKSHFCSIWVWSKRKFKIYRQSDNGMASTSKFEAFFRLVFTRLWLENDDYMVQMVVNCLVFSAGGSEAVRLGRPDVRRVRRAALRRQVCPVLLRQRDLPAVLLRLVLDDDPLAPGQGVPQAARQGGRRQAEDSILPPSLVLTTGLSPAGKMETEGKNLRKKHFWIQQEERNSRKRGKRICLESRKIGKMENLLSLLFPPSFENSGCWEWNRAGEESPDNDLGSMGISSSSFTPFFQNFIISQLFRVEKNNLC